MSDSAASLLPFGLGDFFTNLLAPKEFTAQLLERSFNQPIGWVEAGLALGLMLLSYWLADFLFKRQLLKPETLRWAWLRHIGRRILWPVLMLVSAVISLFIWGLFELSAVWLRLLVLAAHWMIIIRVALAIVHAALPSHKFTDWLERTLSGALWAVFLIRLSGIDDLIVEWMQGLSFTIGSSKLNLWTIVTGLLWLGIILMFAMWLAKFIQTRLLDESNSLDPSLRIMLSNIVRIVMIALSVLIGLPLVGIDLTVLSVFSGALGVGIGFGLQKIASNYISGFLILGDRSIRPGDRLTVNNFTGYVTKITSRFVVLRSSSGMEALIPNETFITNTVINESYTGKALWQSLNIQIAYDSDIARALEIMVEAAKQQERVDNNPQPSAFLIGFNESGIDLRLGFWVKDPENGFLGLFSAILLDIWQRFKEEGIDFPYPQREVRILNEESTSNTAAIQQAAQQAQRNTRSSEEAGADE